MIRLDKSGEYKLIETKAHHRILYLDMKEVYAWIDTNRGGEILVETHNPHIEDYTIAEGWYRLYAVENDPNLTDQLHLELSTGRGKWQGYLLPNGLPNNKTNKGTIIPTQEIITFSRV